MQSFKQLGGFRNVEQLIEYLQQTGSGINCDPENLGRNGPLGNSHRLFGKQLSNRFCIHPMEGWDANPDGTPSDLTLRRWTRFGQSGAKLIWGGEAVAVQADGRANTRQLFNNPDIDFSSSLADLLQTLKQAHQQQFESTDDLLVGLQLTHSGRFARPWSEKLAPMAACRRPLVDRRYQIESEPLITDDQLKTLRDNFVATARLADAAGFDFVDVKCCHSYLLHDLLGAKDRDGHYGGSLENRTRLLREIIEGIRAESPALDIGVRLSLFDFGPFEKDSESGKGVLVQTPEASANSFAEILPDWTADWSDRVLQSEAWTEARQLLDLLTNMGISLFNITLGSPYYCPHMQRPAAYPPSDGYSPPEDPLIGVARHLQATGLVKKHYPQCTVVGTGYSYLQQWLPNIAQRQVADGNVDFIGLGRMVLAYPEMPGDILECKPLERKKICRTFSDCTTGPRTGEVSGCYPLDDLYRTMPQAAKIRKLRSSR